MIDLQEALVALQLTPYIGEKTLSRLMKEGEHRIHRCFSAGEKELKEEFQFHPQSVRHLTHRKAKALENARLVLAALHRVDGDVIPRCDPRYPEPLLALDDEAPPLLYAVGDLQLLQQPSICFLASSHPSPDTISRLRSLADRVAGEGYPIVTGHNRDVYQSAALAAGQHVSPVIYALDCGVLAATADGREQPFPAARIHHHAGQRRLYLSSFRPKDPWIGHNNRKRDRLLAALAHILVAVEVRPGGVMERECLAGLQRGQRVIALAPEGRIPEAHDTLFYSGAFLIQGAEELIRHLWDAGIQPP